MSKLFMSYKYLLLMLYISLAISDKITVGIVSDMHYNPNSDLYGSTPDNYYDEKIHPYGKNGYNPPFRLIRSALKQMKSTIKSAQIFFILGDLIHDDFCQNEKQFLDSEKYHLQKKIISQVVIEAIEILQAPILFCFGNHDFPIVSQPPPNQFKKDFYNNSYNLWIRGNPYNNKYDSEENYNSFMKGGYYSIEMSNYKFIVLNTVYFQEICESDADIANEQLDWIHIEISNAKYKGLKVVFVMHAPPGDFFPYEFKHLLWKKEYEKRFLSSIFLFKSTILLLVAGHLHTTIIVSYSSKHYGFEEHESFFGSLYVSKSLSPWLFNNPGFQQLELDLENKNSKIIEFIFDLDLCNKNPDVDPSQFWIQLYDTYNDLKLENLSPEAISNHRKKQTLNLIHHEKWISYKMGYPKHKIYLTMVTNLIQKQISEIVYHFKKFFKWGKK